MGIKKGSRIFIAIAAIGVLAFSGCRSAGAGDDGNPPFVLSTLPVEDATGVGATSTIRVTFNREMDFSTIIAANLTVTRGAVAVAGTVTYDPPNHVAVFAPTDLLEPDAIHTVSVSTDVFSKAGVPMASGKVWSFTTAPAGLGPQPVNLRTAGKYVILAKSAISTVPASVITGDVGLSPAAESFMTGFSQVKATGYSTSPQVTGYLYAADMTSPTPSNLTTAVSDMETAYTDAAGRPGPDHQDLGSGNIGGLTLVPGLYNWGSSVTVPSDVTISGAENDVWIFQMTGDLTVNTGVAVTLMGGAQARNIFWQVAGAATFHADSHFEGNILSQTAITFQTGASINGRALAQTNVALDQTTVTVPTE